MKIRFWPGICWNTCAVQSDRLRLRADRRAVDRLAALGVAGVGARRRPRACPAAPRLSAVGAVGVDAAVADRVVGGGSGSVAPGGVTPPPRSSVASRNRREVGELGLVVEVDVLGRVERRGRPTAGRVAALVVDACRRARRPRATARRAASHLATVRSSVPVAGAVDAVGDLRAGLERGAGASWSRTRQRQRVPARLVVGEVVGRAAVVEGALHVEHDRRVAGPQVEPVVGVDLELVAAVDAVLVACGPGDISSVG